MSNHLPAGQPAMQGGGVGSYGGQPGYNMSGAPGANGGPGHTSAQPPAHHGRGRARGQHNPYFQQQQQPQQQYYPPPQYNYPGMYAPQYMNPAYGNLGAYQYSPYNMPQQFGQNSMHFQGGYQYQQPPGPMYSQQQNLPPSSYQQSPSIPPYAMNQHQPPSISHSTGSPFSQPPVPMGSNAPAAIPPMPATPASNHSSHVGPNPFAPPTPQPAETLLGQNQYSDQPVNGDFAIEHDLSQQPTPSRPESSAATQSSSLDPLDGPIPTPDPKSIWGALPWSTHEEEPWPKRKRHKKRKPRPIAGQDVTLQSSQADQTETLAVPQADLAEDKPSTVGDVSYDLSHSEETVSTVNVATDTLTTSTTEPAAQVAKHAPPNTSSVATPPQASKGASHNTTFAGLVVPVLPREGPADGNKSEPDKVKTGDRLNDGSHSQAPISEEQQEVKITPRPIFKNWADVARGSAAAKSAAAERESGANGIVGSADSDSGAQISGTSGLAQPNTRAIAEVLRSYRVSNRNKVSFIEPRGLYNSSVDCYINSILQVLLYCLPFYSFLDQVKSQSSFSIKNDIPLLEALIWFRDQFSVIKSAASIEELKMKLKPEEYQQYGEPLRATHVYDIAFSLPVFVKSKLKLGKQQDAEEFLTLLFDGLQTEFARVISGTGDLTNNAPSSSPALSQVTAEASHDDETGWTTVDSRQKSTVTQQSGPPQVSTPLTRIFHGQTRSELRIPGRKVSNTDQTFYTLRLHIDDPSIKNVSQALQHSNVPETIRELSTPRGPATSQVFIHALPHVLVLHLMRFKQLSDNSYRKDGKKVGYPLELQIPPPVLSRQKRNEYSASKTGYPRYQLMAVVYHHGTDMDHGHYSVDVRRQDGQSWLRINDTKIEAITSDAVAEMGVEDAAARPAGAGKETDADGSSSNRFAAMGDDDSVDSGHWEKVGSATNGNKKYSSAVNGKSSGTSTPRGTPAKDKDNKVAYLLFYQQMI